MKRMISGGMNESLKSIVEICTPEFIEQLFRVITVMDDRMLEKLTFLTRVMEYDSEYNCVRFKHGISFDYNVNVAQNLGLQSGMEAIKAGATRVTRRQGVWGDRLTAGNYYTIHALPTSGVLDDVKVFPGAFIIEPTEAEFADWITRGSAEVVDESVLPRSLSIHTVMIPFQPTTVDYFYYRLEGRYVHPQTHEELSNPALRINRNESFIEIPVRVAITQHDCVFCEMVYIDETSQEANPIFKWVDNDLYVLCSDNLTYKKLTPAPVAVEEEQEEHNDDNVE